jgi:hypothetical protein
MYYFVTVPWDMIVHSGTYFIQVPQIHPYSYGLANVNIAQLQFGFAEKLVAGVFVARAHLESNGFVEHFVGVEREEEALLVHRVRGVFDNL